MMMNKNKYRKNILLLVFIIMNANVLVFGQNAPQRENSMPIDKAAPPVIVYKMAKKHINKVPIALSEDKTTIVSYPAPRDITQNSYPTPLKKGYWLDNRGIGENTVFLNITYEDYAKLKIVPNTDQLKKMIIKGNLIKKMYYCGNRFAFQDLEKELNEIIDNKFVNCKRLK